MANKWTYEACLLEAKKYTTKTEFLKSNESAYKIAYRKGWLKEYSWFTLDRKPDGFWNSYDNCFEEAKKYKTISAFQKNAGRAYVISLQNGWIKDYTWFERRQRPNGYWDSYEHCFEEAQKYKSLNEFHDKKKWAYNSARKHGWLNDYTWFKPKGEKKWNRASCYAEAQKYKSRGEFGDKCPGAYNAARKNGWLGEYVWLDTLWQKKWNRETCFTEASKYNSIIEFVRGSAGAYNVARENGWLEDYTWFKRPEAYNKKWTRQKCAEEAKKYNTRGEFQKNSSSAYNVASRNGWLDDYTWLEKRESKPYGYWTREKCFDEALNYRSRKEFQESAPTAYGVARVSGWLDDYTWFQKRVVSDKPIYVVYRYYDEDTNSVYVGLAKNLKQRHKEHCGGFIKHGERKYDTVYRYFHSAGKDVPDPTILEKELYANEAQIYEGLYIEQYKRDGLNILNIAKAGSLGGYTKWTKDKCYEEAQKYNTLLDFRKHAAQAYAVARTNGWIDDYSWLERLSGFWTYDKCAEESKKYKSRTEFQDNCGSAYQAALKNGWLDDYTWLQAPPRQWDYKSCYEEARKCKSRNELSKKAKGAYEMARQNGWLDDYDWLLPSQSSRKWDKESCYLEAKKYKYLKDFQKNAGRAYQIAKRNGWADEYTWLERRYERGHWTREACYEEAKKYKSRTDLARNNMSVYNVARKNRWLDDYTWFIQVKGNKQKG